MERRLWLVVLWVFMLDDGLISHLLSERICEFVLLICRRRRRSMFDLLTTKAAAAAATETGD